MHPLAIHEQRFQRQIDELAAISEAPSPEQIKNGVAVLAHTLAILAAR
jgi:hypothetical protein